MNRTSTGSLLPNQVLGGRYFILHQIAKGGFGAVYKAEIDHPQLGKRSIAIKEIIQKKLSPQELKEAREAFEREATMLANLYHQNLPRISDYFEDAGEWYLVMDFIEGETLEKYLDTLKKLPIQERVQKVLDVGIQLCTVLDYLHKQQPQIIFRDLKPSNIMRTSNGHLYLIDFGIARHFKPGQAKDTFAFVSDGYAAPEQYGHSQTTPQSDIYSLGAIMHQLLSGNEPVDNKPTLFDFPPIPSIPVELEALILQMLEKEEDKRPKSVQNIKDELQRIEAVQKASSSVSPQPTLSQQPVPGSVQPGMQQCSYCHTQNPFGTTFCANCGMNLLGATPPVSSNSPQQPKSPVQQQLVLNPIAVSNQQPVSYNRLDRIFIALVDGAIAGVFALILTWILSNIIHNVWILILLTCIVSCVASFMATWQAWRKWAGVLCAFVTVMTFGVLVIIVSTFDLISTFGLLPPSQIGAVFLSFLIIALIDMLPAFIGAWLATFLRSSRSHTRWITSYIVLLFLLAGIMFLLFPLMQSPISPQSSFIPIPYDSFRTWAWWVVGGLPSVLLGVIAAYKNLSPDLEIPEVLEVGAGAPLIASSLLSFFSSFLINVLHLPQGLLISIVIGAFPTLIGTLYFLIFFNC